MLENVYYCSLLLTVTCVINKLTSVALRELTNVNEGSEIAAVGDNIWRNILYMDSELLVR